MDSFAIISNGNKQKYLYDYLIFHNYSAKLVTNFNLTEYKYIVASIPFSKDGDNFYFIIKTGTDFIWWRI